MLWEIVAGDSRGGSSLDSCVWAAHAHLVQLP